MRKQVQITQDFNDYHLLPVIEEEAAKAYATLGYPVETWEVIPVARYAEYHDVGLLWVARCDERGRSLGWSNFQLRHTQTFTRIQHHA